MYNACSLHDVTVVNIIQCGYYVREDLIFLSCSVRSYYDHYLRCGFYSNKQGSSEFCDIHLTVADAKRL